MREDQEVRVAGLKPIYHMKEHTPSTFNGGKHRIEYTFVKIPTNINAFAGSTSPSTPYKYAH